MTEEEAKQKWCPMMRQGDRIGTCIGSDCMMWRKEKRGFKFLADGGIDLSGVYYAGWCGLAGKP